MANQQNLSFSLIIFTCIYFIVASVNCENDSSKMLALLNDEEIPSGNDDKSPASNTTGGGAIPLALCCPEDSLYKIGFDVCRPLTSNRSSAFHPIVHSVETQQMISEVTDDMFSLADFQLNNCPDGFVSNSTTDFVLYDDGSLRIGSDQFKVGEFCINKVDSWLAVNDDEAEDPPIFAARFCVPDPCVANVLCIRKCCPLGSAIHHQWNELGSLCLPDPTPFDMSLLPFQSPAEGEEKFDSTNFSIHSGIGLKCYDNGLHQLDLELTGTFVIVGDGELQITNPSTPEISQQMREYCVDHFIDQNTTGLIGLRCLLLNRVTRGLHVYPYAYIVSSAFALATFFVHAILAELRNIHGVVVMCYVASMSAMYVGLGIINLNIDIDMSDAVCFSFPVFVHFAFLATSSWLNIVCFDVWRTFGCEMQASNNSSKNQLGRPFLFYSVYGWGVPFLIVLVGQLFQHVNGLSDYVITPDFGTFNCWFNDENRWSVILYLYGPLMIMYLANVLMFLWTAITFCKASIQLSKVTSVTRSNQTFRVILCLFFLMGVSWISESVSYLSDGQFTHWVFLDIVNISTGVFVFIIFVCKPKIWKLLKLRVSALLATPTGRRILPCIGRPDHGTRNNPNRRQMTNETVLSSSFHHSDSISN